MHIVDFEALINMEKGDLEEDPWEFSFKKCALYSLQWFLEILRTEMNFFVKN